MAGFTSGFRRMGFIAPGGDVDVRRTPPLTLWLRID